MLASQEVHDIAVALGVDPGIDDLDRLRYGKVCILADADSDGLHIATCSARCSCAISGRWCRAGHVYVAMPPLYRIDASARRSSTRSTRTRRRRAAPVEAEKKKGKVNVSASRASAR
jgi:topoisomerase-4 subunit B